LATWLRQYGHLLNMFSITAQEPEGQQQQHDAYLEACQIIPSIFDALAAAGGRSSGLRVRQLRLPAFPGTPVFTVCKALSACPHLQELRLANSYSGATAPSSLSTFMKLPAALQQLTQLTRLELEGGMFQYNGQIAAQGVDGLFRALPSSLVKLKVHDKCQGCTTPAVHLCTSSLQHLVCLRDLELPQDTCVTDHGACDDSRGDTSRGTINTCSGGGASSSSPLGGLTALTALECATALRVTGSPLLALPNLVELWAGEAEPHLLEALPGKSALRLLAFVMCLPQHQEQAAAVAQMTQLTALVLIGPDVDGDLPEEWLDVEGEVDELLVKGAMEEWGCILSTLTGLRRLVLEPPMLQEVDLAALTSLTHLSVELRYCQPLHTQERMQELLNSLAPARGRVQHVTLVGLPASLHDGCRAAVPAALGDVHWHFNQPR
jgi:hypothetical protein